MTLQRAPCHDQAAICRAGEGRDGALDLAGSRTSIGSRRGSRASKNNLV
jgi:hypothetical protein